MELNKRIKDFLEEEGLKYVSVLHYSKWKRSLVLKVENHGKYFVLKTIEANAPKTIKAKFKKELQFFKNQKCLCVPRLLFYKDDIIVMEYIYGRTLREVVLSQSFDLTLTKKLSEGVISLYQSYFCDDKIRIDFKNAYLNLSALGQSGPFQTEELRFPDKIVNKALVQILKFRLKYILKRINPEKLKKGFYHGDFHFNNIYVSKSNEIKFIDFENLGHDGCFDFDLLYLLTMMGNFMKGTEEFEKLENNFFAFLGQSSTLKEVYLLYQIAISLNHRFGSKRISLLNKVGLVLGYKL